MSLIWKQFLALKFMINLNIYTVIISLVRLIRGGWNSQRRGMKDDVLKRSKKRGNWRKERNARKGAAGHVYSRPLALASWIFLFLFFSPFFSLSLGSHVRSKKFLFCILRPLFGNSCPAEEMLFSIVSLLIASFCLFFSLSARHHA